MMIYHMLKTYNVGSLTLFQFVTKQIHDHTSLKMPTKNEEVEPMSSLVELHPLSVSAKGPT
jgi:hypothetical protein